MSTFISLHLVVLKNQCSTGVICLLLACSTNTQSGQLLKTLTRVGKRQTFNLQKVLFHTVN